MGRGVDPLMEGGGGGQFLNQKVRKGWRQGKSVWRMVSGQILVGRSHIRRGRAFRGLGLFEGVRMRQWLGLWKV